MQARQPFVLVPALGTAADDGVGINQAGEWIKLVVVE
jgi:hypothetical protein